MDLEGRTQTEANSLQSVCPEKNLWHNQAGSTKQCRHQARLGYQIGHSAACAETETDLLRACGSHGPWTTTDTLTYYYVGMEVDNDQEADQRKNGLTT